MHKAFYEDNTNFSSWSTEHFIACLVMLLLGIYMIYQGRNKWNEQQQARYISILVGLALFLQVIKPFIRQYLGVFDITEDLPLHLCNIIPFFMFPAMYLKWRMVWGVIFFWTVCGTLQAMITPTLTDAFPHYENIRYWIIHGGLPIAAVYGVFVYKWRLTWIDMLLSMFFLNVLALVLTPINLRLGANYLYLRFKPPGDTIYNHLGPWPYYIVSIEVMMVVLFGILVLMSKNSPVKRKLA